MPVNKYGKIALYVILLVFFSIIGYGIARKITRGNAYTPKKLPKENGQMPMPADWDPSLLIKELYDNIHDIFVLTNTKIESFAKILLLNEAQTTHLANEYYKFSLANGSDESLRSAIFGEYIWDAGDTMNLLTQKFNALGLL